MFKEKLVIDIMKRNYSKIQCLIRDTLELDIDILVNGEPFNIESFDILIEQGLDNGNFNIQNTEIIKNKNNFVCSLSNKFTSIKGKHFIDVSIIKNDYKKTTFKIPFDVYEGAIQEDSKEQEIYISILEEIKGEIIKGNNLNNELKSEITEGNALKNELTTKINEGNTLKNNLTSKINEGNTLKSELSTKINDGNDLKNELISYISTGNDVKNNLNQIITSGESLKSELDKFVNTAPNLEYVSKIPTIESELSEYKKESKNEISILKEQYSENNQRVSNLENDNNNIKKIMNIPLGKPKFSTLAFLPYNNLSSFVIQSMCFNYNTKTIVVLYANKDADIQEGYLVGYDSETFTVKQSPVKLVTHHGNGITYVDKGEIQEYKIATSINKVLTVGTDFQKKYEEELEVPYVQGIAHYREKDDNIIAYTKDSTYYLAYQKRISETSVYYEKNEYGACQDIEIGEDYIVGVYQWGIRYFDKETLNLIKEYPVPSYPRTELQGICKYYNPNNIWEPRKNTFLTGLLGFRSSTESIHGTTIGTDIMAPRLMKFNNSVDDLNDTKITKNGYLNMEVINLAYTFEKQSDNSWDLIDDYSNPNSHLTNNITSFKRTSPQYALFENTLDFWATQSQGLIYDIVNSQCEIVPYVTGTQVPCGVTSYYYSRSGLYVRFYELSTGVTKDSDTLPAKTRVRCTISLRVRGV